MDLMLVLLATVYHQLAKLLLLSSYSFGKKDARRNKFAIFKRTGMDSQKGSPPPPMISRPRAPLWFNQALGAPSIAPNKKICYKCAHLL